MADDDLITDDELYEHYSFKAGKGQEPLRVDKFLMNFVENASQNKVQQAAKDGNIFVNRSNSIVWVNLIQHLGDLKGDFAWH